MKMKCDDLYRADNARFTVEEMDLQRVNAVQRDAEMRNLFDLLDEFYIHGVKPKCQEGMGSHKYAFGYWTEFSYGKFEDIKIWNISNQTYQRMAPTLMSHPGIFRELKDENWSKIGGFKNDCGFSSLNRGLHFSGDVDTWHHNRELYFQTNQKDIDWSNRNDFLPNKHRSDNLLQKRIDKFVENLVEEEAQKNQWTEEEYRNNYSNRCKEIKDKLDKNVGVSFHENVMNDNDGSLKAIAEEIGTQICKTNFYVYEEKLTKDERKASGSSRKIFSLINKKGEKQYISIDFAHGMFEFLNHKGDHLGEFRFNGMPNKPANPSHSLKTL